MCLLLCLLLMHPLLSLAVRSAGHAYAAVISACAAGGRWQKAVALFDEMLSWGIKPDVVSCTALITALGTDGQWERAEKVGGGGVWVCVGVWFVQAGVSRDGWWLEPG